MKLHRECKTNKAKRDAYWQQHAKEAFIDRQLFKWAATQFQESHEDPRERSLPSDAERESQKQRLEAQCDPACVAVPSGCVERQLAMHAAVVTKIEEFLQETASTGEADAAAEVAGAPTSNVPVEDVFQYSRRWHDRHCTTRIGIIEAARRVRKAPDLGEPVCLESPPKWYPTWLKKSLRQRARHRIRKQWLSMAERAHRRWEQTKLVSQRAGERAQAAGDRAESKEDRVRTMEGGEVGSGEEAERLPPLTLLDLETFASIDFGQAPTWKVAEIKNQICLRNLQKDKRSDALNKLLIEKKLIKSAGAALLEGGSKSVLIKRLEAVVKVEERAEALAKGQRELEAADAVRRAQDERREQVQRARRRPAHLANYEQA